MTTQFESMMADGLRMASLSDLLPSAGSPPRGWRARLPRFSWRRPRGLAAVPERYRLQFLLLASDAMPGAAPAKVAEMAGTLAGQVKIPKRLLAKLPDTGDLDRWFRDNCEQIKESLAELLEAGTR